MQEENRRSSWAIWQGVLGIVFLIASLILLRLVGVDAYIPFIFLAITLLVAGISEQRAHTRHLQLLKELRRERGPLNCVENQNLDKRLETEIRKHLNRYVDVYDKATDKADLDLLEYRMDNKDPKSNRIIDRDLLSDYLSLKLANSNYRLQWLVAIFAFASSTSAVIGLLKILNWIP